MAGRRETGGHRKGWSASYRAVESERTGSLENTLDQAESVSGEGGMA